MIRAAAGFTAVALLKGIATLPVPLAHALALPLLPFYLALRPRTLARLRSAATSTSFAPLYFPFIYYSRRTRLALLSLRHLLGKPDGCIRIVENAERYHAALDTGKPVVLLGWHQGPVELLHRIPHSDPAAEGRVKILMTAGAFAPTLASFLHAGRTVDGKEIVRPGDMNALRRWARQSGILAVMTDQVPGRPQDWIALGTSGYQTPYPARLMEWIETRAPECLIVSVRWEPGNRIRFRYQSVTRMAETLTSTRFANLPVTLKDVLGACLNGDERGEESGTIVPEQYNWSYPKITRL